MKKMDKASQILLKIGGRELLIPVEFKVGTHWGSMEEYKYKNEEAA